MHLLLLLFRFCPWLSSFLLVVPLLLASSHAQSVPVSVLTSGQPVLGSLAANATAYYSFTSSAVPYQQTALLSVAAALGFPSLYVSLSNRQPSAGSFDYFASWQTGGAVSVASQQPPYTLYVAVQASPYSRCNYTLTAEAYDTGTAQSTPIPLYDAQPTSSAIAAGEYRYFAYNVSANASASTATIALTETYGQSWLLLNSPNATQLPTLAQAQYMSASATFPLVALQQPAAGVWTIGVWCNASSAFSIIAAASSQTQPMLLGVSYPGWVAAGQYAYYSLYIDALQLASSSAGYLDLELYSLQGSTALYCSNRTVQPNRNEYRWYTSTRLSIPAAQLQAGPLYCGVYNYYGSGNYIFSASYGSPIVLTTGETVSAQSPAAGSQLYSLVFPADSSLVTVSVVADVGATELYISQFGEPPNGQNHIFHASEASVQFIQLYTSYLCGDNNAQAIPGSSPPLCEMQVLVTSSIPTIYHITATSSSIQYVQLLPGEPMEGAASVNQSAHLSFTIPDNLSNATLLITVTNGGTGLVLAAGTEYAAAVRTLWVVSQQPDSSDLVFQLDWNDPRLPRNNDFEGDYVAVLSTTSDIPITFTIVYTVANASVYSSTIVQLLDGQPQDGVVTLNNYGFYYFTPPAAGWPYTVSVDVTWTSGVGYVLIGVSQGPQVGPLSIKDASYGGYGGLTLIPPEPDYGGVCNPSSSSTCGYGISVQGNGRQYQQVEYTVTVSSTRWTRALYMNRPALAGTELAVDDSDYWRAAVALHPAAINPRLMLAVTMLSGTVAVFVSTVKSPDNATTAQLTWTNVTSTAVLAFPMVQPPSTDRRTFVYVTLVCTSTDSTACQYTLQGQTYDEGRHSVQIESVPSAPDNVLLPAGGITWLYYSLWSYNWLGYLIMQASAPVGVPSLYAACTSQLSAAVQPNETYHTWQAVGAAPLAIELTDLNVTAARCQYLVLGVRASGGQAALAVVSAVSAGVEQDISAETEAIGLITPA